MKALVKIIIIVVTFNLVTAGFTLAQPTSPPGLPDIEPTEASGIVRPAAGSSVSLGYGSGGGYGGGGAFLPRHRGASKVLVIPAAEIETEDLAAITEDMNVMLRVLEHKLSQALPAPGRGNWFVGFNSFFGRDSGAPEAIYIEGYGALFLMKVDFPLSPPKVQEEEKEVKEEDADPVWEQMKQDMYAPERDVRIRRMTNRPEEEYDAEKVEKLKTTLIEALKHAANIRGLKPDESIILTITGSGESASQTVGMVSKTNKYVIVENDNSSGMASGYFSGDTEPSSPAVLVIRAKRSDIDAFSKGDLDYDQFGQKVQIFTCPYLGENIGGIPPGPAQRGREARGENRVRTERRR